MHKKKSVLWVLIVGIILVSLGWYFYAGKKLTSNQLGKVTQNSRQLLVKYNLSSPSFEKPDILDQTRRKINFSLSKNFLSDTNELYVELKKSQLAKKIINIKIIESADKLPNIVVNGKDVVAGYSVTTSKDTVEIIIGLSPTIASSDDLSFALTRSYLLALLVAEEYEKTLGDTSYKPKYEENQIRIYNYIISQNNENKTILDFK